MDLRNPVLAILCGGAPAPGINGVISSLTIEALNSSCSVLGFFEGFKQLKQGKSMAMNIEFNDVTRIYSTGGSLLRTSKQQLSTATDVDNCLRVLQHHRVRYLVTIGGSQTAYSASLLVTAAAAAKYKLSCVHVPKTIFNDLPLGEGCRTFGFSTAREVGATLVQNFANDARTMLRWYILVVMGQKAGHLALGIGKAGASTLTIIGEDYLNRSTPLTFSELATVLEGAIYKRRAMQKEYGVACISESLVSCMDPREMTERFGDLDTAHSELGRHLVIELQRRFAKRGIEQTTVSRNIGNELRSAPPNASDITLTRDLGFAATRVLMEGGNGCVITLRSGGIHVIPFASILDPAHSSTQIRLVDTHSLSYQVAQSYSIMLRQPDLLDTSFLQKLAKAGNMTPSDFILTFQGVAASAPPYRQPQTAGVSYAFMNDAFPPPASSTAEALAAAATASSSLSSSTLTPQTKSQLTAHVPSAQHIAGAHHAGGGLASRKGSEREAFSASPPYAQNPAAAAAAAAAAVAAAAAAASRTSSPRSAAAASLSGQLHLNLAHRGSSAGATDKGSTGAPLPLGADSFSSAAAAAAAGAPAMAPMQPHRSGWFHSSSIFEASQPRRISNASPTPPHMLASGGETPTSGSQAPLRSFPTPPATVQQQATGAGAATADTKDPR